ncbi:MAG: FAD-dependent oxidoreductase [Clostridiales bacterium]|jgi:formate dehydrogenase major subunit|nr:FAD-dependent oxidoreductase [Clostridiales bacterium]
MLKEGHKFGILVDGREVTATEDYLLLDVLEDAGIEIPHLCHDVSLEPYGGCGLCLVEIAGQTRPARACATKVWPGMEVVTENEAIHSARALSLQLLLSDHLGDCRPPCYNACPGNNDCQGYIGLIANGQPLAALKLIKENNPIPASIGRVCPHPCQDDCRRGLLEGPLSIARLKQYAADYDLAQMQPYLPQAAPPSGKKVAIIGAGPGGLSAAWFLALSGHKAEIFEAQNKPGGMLRYGIPDYRLPQNIIDREVALIQSLGVKINYNQKLGRDLDLAGLRQEYDAVFLALGAWQSSALGCEGEELRGVFGGIDFLYEVAQGQNPDIGQKVAVVGGGNTAMDAARTALRLGAREVSIIYRRTKQEMPAASWEIEEAEEEGVIMRYLLAPLKVVPGADGKVRAMLCQQMRLGEPDASGRRRPEPVPGAEELIELDSVIAAIGQKVITCDLEDLELTRWKTIITDPESMATNLPGVFAGGDAVNDGPGIAITAVGHAKKAAMAIDAYFRGNPLAPFKPFYLEGQDLTKEDFPDIAELPPLHPQVEAPEIRRQDFREFVHGFTGEEAEKEAARCLECGCQAVHDCHLLPLLQKYNPDGEVFAGRIHHYEVDKDHPFISREPEKCILCGLCLRVCREHQGVYALGWLGRGFDTIVSPAFARPLADSDCISCGACAAICPTGALRQRNPQGKTPPLPTKAKLITCPHCSRKCYLMLHHYQGLAVKAEPLNSRESCGIGRFALVWAAGAAPQDLQCLSPGEKEKILQAITGDLRYFAGDKEQFSSLERTLDLLKKN